MPQPLDQPEVSDELGAVNFLDEGDVVSPLTSERKVGFQLCSSSWLLSVSWIMT